jgi:hypothetical protein
VPRKNPVNLGRRRKQEELLRVSQQSCLSKKREKTSVKRKDVDGETVGSKESTPIIRISKNRKTSGVGGLHAGNYYIGGEFEIQRSLTRKKKLDT